MQTRGGLLVKVRMRRRSSEAVALQNREVDVAIVGLALNCFIHCVKYGKDGLLHTILTIKTGNTIHFMAYLTSILYLFVHN